MRQDNKSPAQRVATSATHAQYGASKLMQWRRVKLLQSKALAFTCSTSGEQQDVPCLAWTLASHRPEALCLSARCPEPYFETVSICSETV